MRFKKIYHNLLLSLALTLASSASHALTIGEPQLKSSINEPLEAILPILSLTEQERSVLSIKNASADIYRAMGLPYSRELKKVSIRLKKDNGQHYIELTTPYHVREPMLELVLTIEQNRGQLIRNVTLMLEPGDL